MKKHIFITMLFVVLCIAVAGCSDILHESSEDKILKFNTLVDEITTLYGDEFESKQQEIQDIFLELLQSEPFIDPPILNNNNFIAIPNYPTHFYELRITYPTALQHSVLYYTGFNSPQKISEVWVTAGTDETFYGYRLDGDEIVVYKIFKSNTGNSKMRKITERYARENGRWIMADSNITFDTSAENGESFMTKFYYYVDPYMFDYYDVPISIEDMVADVKFKFKEINGIEIDNIWYEGTKLNVDLNKNTPVNAGTTGSTAISGVVVRTFTTFPNVDTIEVLVGGKRGQEGDHFSYNCLFIIKPDGKIIERWNESSWQYQYYTESEFQSYIN